MKPDVISGDAIEQQLIKNGYQKDASGIFVSEGEGYWSNLSKEESRNLLSTAAEIGPLRAVRKLIPHLEKMIFSEKREAALELLNLGGTGICIDFGCMWGVLSIGMAKRGYDVISIDQTYDSLEFLNLRKKEERIDNIYPTQCDIRNFKIDGIADCAIVNGVLEWIPESGEIEIGAYYGKKVRKSYAGNPAEMQYNFLATTFKSLKPGGKLLLAIENRYDYSRFIGKRDPHANIFFTSILPRPISNLISKMVLGRPYRNYIYSFRKLEKMVLKAGYSSVELYMSFPDYHFPELILPYREKGIDSYKSYPCFQRTTKKQKIAYYFEYLIMKYLKAKHFAPAIMLVAQK